MPDHVVLVLNAGSSSLKYRVIQQPGDRLLGDTIQRVERDGFEAAFDQVVQDVEAAGLAGRLTGIGHRVVHGGTRHTQPVRVDGGLIADVEDLARLAPLHNPPAVAGMRHARAAYPDVPQLAVPRHILDRLDADPDAGIDLAVQLVLDVRDSNAFDGAHLIPVNRHRQLAAALEPALR